MFEHKKIGSLDDYFLPLNKRSQKSVFFYRICGANEEINNFIVKYYELTRKIGVMIDGKIPNPDGRNLSFFNEMMGTDFQLDKFFIGQSLNRWLPRMSNLQCSALADALYAALVALKNMGKNPNVLKNSYIKFMCWLYYRFEAVVNRLGNNDVPKILCEGEIGIYELYFLSMLNHAGCDIVLLQYDEGKSYQTLDPRSMLSDILTLPNMKAFSADFGIRSIQQLILEKEEREKLYGILPNVSNCTNAWLSGEVLEDIRKTPSTRGEDNRFFYNAFCRMYGVEDRITYQNEIYRFYLDIKNSGRRFCIIENEIPVPTPAEISFINKGNYTRKEQLLSDLSAKIRFVQNPELERIMVKAFLDTLLEDSKQPDVTLNRLTNKAVYLLCWLFRYMQELFAGWSMPFVSVFIYLGGCKTEYEVLFCKMLSKMPCDVLILVPNLNTKCILEDKAIYEVKYSQTANMTIFPTENSGVQMATAAYHAERDLDEIMYTGTGMYRDHQYAKANSITLKTMFEEIDILWHQDLKFRPNFSTVDDTVNMPVIFAKISGVKDGNAAKYWQYIKSLLTEDTFLIYGVPFITPNEPNPMKYHAASFFRNGKVQNDVIMRNPQYQYAMLREETQRHILDKLQVLIDSRLIAGTFVNGTEYNIIATVLNMRMDLVRMIQKFDFTKQNPKLIYINTSEFSITQEDAIITAFLNLIGFDIVFFVPTGYQTVENHFSRNVLDEHQIGSYMYDLQVPKMKIPPPKPVKGAKNSLFKSIFKKGK